MSLPVVGDQWPDDVVGAGHLAWDTGGVWWTRYIWAFPPREPDTVRLNAGGSTRAGCRQDGSFTWCQLAPPSLEAIRPVVLQQSVLKLLQPLAPPMVQRLSWPASMSGPG